MGCIHASADLCSDQHEKSKILANGMQVALNSLEVIRNVEEREGGTSEFRQMRLHAGVRVRVRKPITDY
jgi:hypothetical protein